MPIERIVDSSPLRNVDVRSLAPAYATVARSLAGRVRYLYELATGTAAFPDGGATPLNPQGRLGIDHSGPPWGSAHTHPVWYSEGLPQISGATEVYGESPVVSLVTQDTTLKIDAAFQLRPFQQIENTPYSRAYLYLGATRIGASGTATATVRIYDSGEAETNAASRSSTVTSTSETVQTDLASAIYTIVQPGYNQRLIELTLTSTTGMRIWMMSLNQIVNRSH